MGDLRNDYRKLYPAAERAEPKPEPCACSQLDWTNCEQTKQHHPDCDALKVAPLIDDIAHPTRDVYERLAAQLRPEYGSLNLESLNAAIDKMGRHAAGERNKLVERIYSEPYHQPPRRHDGSIIGEPYRSEADPRHSLYPTTIPQLIAAMELPFSAGEPTDHGMSVTGEEYVTLTTGGIKREGERIGVYATYPEKAIELFFGQWHEYWHEVFGGWQRKTLKVGFKASPEWKLYWRQKPVLRPWLLMDETGEPASFYTVTARLLVSDKPQIATAIAQPYNEAYFGPSIAKLAQEIEDELQAITSKPPVDDWQPRTIEELTAEIEALFTIGESTETPFAVTGEPYKKFGIGFKAASDVTAKELSRLRQNAISATWRTALKLHALNGPGATLYWRRKPTLHEERKIDGVLQGELSMRLLVSPSRL